MWSFIVRVRVIATPPHSTPATPRDSRRQVHTRHPHSSAKRPKPSPRIINPPLLPHPSPAQFQTSAPPRIARKEPSQWWYATHPALHQEKHPINLTNLALPTARKTSPLHLRRNHGLRLSGGREEINRLDVSASVSEHPPPPPPPPTYSLWHVVVVKL